MECVPVDFCLQLRSSVERSRKVFLHPASFNLLHPREIAFDATFRAFHFRKVLFQG